jgi:cell division septum initiation protein DivIVA
MMMGIEDMADKAFARTPSGEGYMVAEVEQFRSDAVDAVTVRDKVISELQVQLASARMRLAEGPAEKGPAEHGHADRHRHESSVSAARLLEMATVNAEQLVAEATAEAASLLGSAHAVAEQLVMTSHAEAERVRTELARHSEQRVAELDRQRGAVLVEVESLRQLERDHRNHLRDHFIEQLALLEDAPVGLRAVASD